MMTSEMKPLTTIDTSTRGGPLPGEPAPGVVDPSADAGATPPADATDAASARADERSVASRPGIVQTLLLWAGHDTVPIMAAALAYRTIFSLIPLLFIGMLILGLFQDRATLVRDILARLLDQTGLSQVLATNSAESSFDLQAWLDTVVGKVGTISFTGIGLVSVLTLAYAAISLMMEMERSFNALFGVSRGRPIRQQLMQYWLMISLGPLLVAASFMIGEQFRRLAQSLAEQGGQIVDGVSGGSIGLASGLVVLAGYATTVLVTGGLLWVLYLTLPNTRVKPLPAFYGALVGGMLLELAKYGFSLYLAHAGFKTLYGSLALLPIFLMWIYVTWVIVLVGVRTTALIQHGALRSGALVRAVAALGGARSLAPVSADASSAISVAAAVARAFARGKALDADAIAQRTGLDVVVCRQIARRLQDRGVLHTISQPGRDPRYALARPPSDVSLRELLEVGHALMQTPVPGSSSEGDALVTMRRAALASLGTRSLADLVADR